MSFGAITPSSLYEFDKPWTPLASSSESYALAMQAQSGVGFAVPYHLAFNAVLRDDFGTWALPSVSFAER